MLAEASKGKVRLGFFAALAAALVSSGVLAGPPGVRINEAVASNGGTAEDSDGDSSDWIELFNDGSEAASLEGWG